MIIPFDITGTLQDGTETLVRGPLTSGTITRVALSAEVAPTASAVLRVQASSGAAVTPAIDVTLAAGAIHAAATGSVPIGADAPIYIRVVAGGGAEFVHGYIEVADALTQAAPELVSLATVKQLRGITDTASDALLQFLIASVSRRIQDYLGRQLVKRTVVDELHSPSGRSDTILLREYPVEQVLAVRLDGTALAASEYDLDAPAGRLRYTRGAWPAGPLRVSVDYVGGYDPVPEAVQLAAATQVIYEFNRFALRAEAVGKRQATIEDGASVTYLVDAWHPGVRDALDPYRVLEEAL